MCSRRNLRSGLVLVCSVLVALAFTASTARGAECTLPAGGGSCTLECPVAGSSAFVEAYGIGAAVFIGCPNTISVVDCSSASVLEDLELPGFGCRAQGLGDFSGPCECRTYYPLGSGVITSARCLCQ